MELCCPHMANAVYATLCDSHFCAENRTHGKIQRQLELFLLKGLLEYMGMDILETLPKTERGSQFVIVIIDRCTKLTEAVPSTKTNAHQFRTCSSSTELQITVCYPVCQPTTTPNSCQNSFCQPVAHSRWIMYPSLSCPHEPTARWKDSSLL